MQRSNLGSRICNGTCVCSKTVGIIFDRFGLRPKSSQSGVDGARTYLCMAHVSLQDHEFIQSDTDLQHCVPFIFHVDGAEVFKNCEYHVFSMRSAFASHDEVLDTQLYILAVPQKIMHRKEVRRRVHRVVAKYIGWNVTVLQTGIGPEVGFYQEAFPPKSVAARLAGKPLTKDSWHAVFFGFKQQFCLGIGCQDTSVFSKQCETNQPRNRPTA
jgi:hypothetical protein